MHCLLTIWSKFILTDKKCSKCVGTSFAKCNPCVSDIQLTWCYKQDTLFNWGLTSLSVVLWQSVLLFEKARVPGKKQQLTILTMCNQSKSLHFCMVQRIVISYSEQYTVISKIIVHIFFREW